MYCAKFLAGAIASFVWLRGAAFVKLLLLGLAESCFDYLSILGVVLVDVAQHRVSWTAPGIWLCFGVFALLFVVGLGLTWLALIRRRARSGHWAAPLSSLEAPGIMPWSDYAPHPV